MKSAKAKTEIQHYYTNSVAEEWERLTKDPLRVLEYKTTVKYMRKYMPKHGTVLDAGCGPGMYSLGLAKSGYDIVMLDLTPANLEFAMGQIRKAKLSRRVKQSVQGQIEDLSGFKSGTFDVVICLGGPLSHVMDRRSRDRAAAELVRVAKPGAPIFVSVMNRIPFILSLLKVFRDEVDSSYFKAIIKSGDYTGGLGFTPFHAFLPDELMQTFKSNGVEVLGGIGLEGFGTYTEDEIRNLYRNKAKWHEWIATHDKFSKDPYAASGSNHMLIICRKRK